MNMQLQSGVLIPIHKGDSDRYITITRHFRIGHHHDCYNPLEIAAEI